MEDLIYELHLTTTPDVDLDSWADACNELGVKPLDIRLHGEDIEHDRQIMFAGVFDGTEEKADYWVLYCQSFMESHGFSIERTKIEVPLDKSASYKEPVYHEAHVKCLLTPDQADANLRLAAREEWVASYNALSMDYDGFAKWYFTQRRPGNWDYRDAGSFFSTMFSNFNPIGSVRMEKETVIYDSRPELDTGWV